MGLKVFSEAAKFNTFVELVVECSVSFKSWAVKSSEDIRSKNADMSNDKECLSTLAVNPRFSMLS